MKYLSLMKSKMGALFVTVLSAFVLAAPAAAEPTVTTIDWSTLLPAVGTAFVGMIGDFVAELDPIILAGLSITMTLIGVSLIRRVLSSSGGR